MLNVASPAIINGMFELVDERLCMDYDIGVYEENSAKINIYIYSKEVLANILKEFKFKNIGSMDDYPGYFPKPDQYSETDIPTDMDYFQKVAISEKINSIVVYTGTSYGSYHCMFIVSQDNFKKFITKAKNYIQFEDAVNMFSSVEFKPTEKNQYFEIIPSVKRRSEGPPVDVIKKKVKNENLIFDKESQIYTVMSDIELFFTKETKKMYKTIDIPYKRGIIIYGDPGNGKSAMIREIIRVLPKKIIKIIISPGTRNVTEILSSLVDKLDGKEAIIVIEDIDSLITSYNRSEFLNILDGVDSKSGIYFIGSTNYPDKIDPAFMNRSGRFDRTFEIGNPSEKVRKMYFENHNVSEILKEFRLSDDPENTLNVIDMFTKYSENMSMANLKELILSVKMELVKDLESSKTIEEAVKTCSKLLMDSKEKHTESHNKYKQSLNTRRFDEYNEDDMYEDD